MIKGISRSLSKMSGEKYDGCYMVKANLEIFQRNNASQDYEVNIEKANEKITIIKSKSYFKGTLSMVLTISLINGSIKKENKLISQKKDLSEMTLKHFRKITKDEVYKFSKYTGDINSIHLTDKPVVQGLLILMHLEKYIKEGKNIEVKFISLLYADTSIYISESENTILGYSENKLCFKVKYKN